MDSSFKNKNIKIENFNWVLIQSDMKIKKALNTISIRLQETWSHLIAPYQEKPGLNEIISR